MKKLAILILTLTMMLALASCEMFADEVDKLVTEATAPLVETIETLEATKTELENAKATLETAKATLEEAKTKLEAEKAALDDEKAALEEKVAALLNCAKGEHTTTVVKNEDLTHTETCSYCEFKETVRCEFPDYVDNGDGSYTGTCPTCNNTDTRDVSQLFVVVRTEDELREAASVDGTKIRLGADIDVLDCIHINNYIHVEIDMAGYSINCDDPSLNEFFVYGSLRIYDSVGGSSITNGFNTYDGTYIKVGNIKLDRDDPIGAEGTIDLSEYRGGELKMYVAYFTDLIIPEGYVIVDQLYENPTTDFSVAVDYGWIILTPPTE